MVAVAFAIMFIGLFAVDAYTVAHSTAEEKAKRELDKKANSAFNGFMFFILVGFMISVVVGLVK